MVPTLHAGDMVIIKRAATYHVRQVVAYRRNPRAEIVVHRVVSRDDGLFLLKGDNNPWPDTGAVSSSGILGRKVWVVPHGRRIIQATLSVLGLVAVVAIWWPHRSVAVSATHKLARAVRGVWTRLFG